MTSDKDDWDLEAGTSQLALKLEPTNSWQAHVQNKATWTVWPVPSKKFFRCLKAFAPKTRRLQQALDGGTHTSIVINDEHRGSVGARYFRLSHGW